MPLRSRDQTMRKFLLCINYQFYSILKKYTPHWLQRKIVFIFQSEEYYRNTSALKIIFLSVKEFFKVSMTQSIN